MENYSGSTSSSHASSSVVGFSFTDDIDPAIDLFIGGLVILLTIFGVLGNLTSFLYFYRRRKKTIHDMLYSVISVVNCLTSASMFPFLVSLLSSRSPKLFQSPAVCISWPILYFILIRVSMVVVALISVSRTVVIISSRGRDLMTHCRIMILGVVGYATLLLSLDVICLSTGLLEVRYLIPTSIVQSLQTQGFTYSFVNLCTSCHVWS